MSSTIKSFIVDYTGSQGEQTALDVRKSISQVQWQAGLSDERGRITEDNIDQLFQYAKKEHSSLLESYINNYQEE